MNGAEAVASHHAERIPAPLQSASYEELRFSYRVVDVWRLPRPANSAFHPERRLLWTEGHDLFSDQPVWVPYELVHTDYTLPPPTGSGCFPATSNGLASGNHLLEATSHAITELVERDASTLWALGGIEVCVWDTTTDVGLPAFES